MTNLRLAQVAAILSMLAAGSGNAQTDPTMLRFIHPDAKALVSIDWKRVRQSHLGTMIREKWVDQNTGAIPGIEFLDDLDRVLISSPGRNAADPSADAPLLIVASGRFDLEKVRNVLATNGAKPQMFNNTQVYRPQGKSGKDMAFVLLDAQTILIGDARSVFASLERTAFSVPPAPNPVANPLLLRAAQLDANFDIWAVMSTPGALASDRLMSMFTGNDLTADAGAFEIGLSLRSGLTIESAVMFQAESSAKHMASELSRLLKLTMKDKMGEPAVLDLEKKLKITSEGAQVKIAVHMTQQELEKNAQIFTASHSKPAAAVADVRPRDPAVSGVRPLTLPPADPPKPEKKVIRIEGLDEGTREIPYREHQ